MIFSNEFVIFLVIFCVKYVETYPRLTDCSSMVTSKTTSFIGCEDRVKTDSLRKSKTKLKTIYTFKGIPYAEPPVGPLRFRKTVEKVYNKPTLVDARRYHKPCMQPWIVDYPFGSMSEDCLYLNIWTPSLNNNANLPVMFWIYGGAFSVGSGSQFGALYLTTDNIFSGRQLAIRDVVVVTINYRLGVFGFLYGNSSDCPGNQGFWDQAMALKWVKDNIRAFGGNPNDITLFGESAGSISISNHIVSNVTRNMFQRVVMQSGSAYIKLFSRDRDYSYKIGRRFASNRRLFTTGACIHGQDWIECLRTKSASELMWAQIMSIFWNPSEPWYSVYIQQFSPVFGDEFIPMSVNKAIKEGNFNKDIKALIGHQEMEGLLFSMGFDLLVGLKGRYMPFISKAPVISRSIVFNDIRKYFFDNDTIGLGIAKAFTETFDENPRRLDGNGIRRSAVHAFGDYFLTCPTILFGAHLSMANDFKGKVYQYRLTYAHKQSFARRSVWAEATHTDDIALVFGSPFTDPSLWTHEDRRMSRQMMDIWTHFAKQDELPEVNGNVWPTYNKTIDGKVNVSYIELHPKSERLGRVWTNRYNLDDDRNPPIIGDCFYYWDQILSDQF